MRRAVKKPRSIYAEIYVKGSHRARYTPRVSRPWRPRVIAWAGPAAFYRNRFYKIDNWYKARIDKPEQLPQLHVIDPADHLQSLAERLAKVDVATDKVINIGYIVEPNRPSDDEIRAHRQTRDHLEGAARRNELLIDLKVAELDNMNSSMVKQVAQHNRIYEHLFHRDAVFDPIVRLDVKYPNDASVYFGNPLAPDECTTQPDVSFESPVDDYWTLLMTNPDGNPFEENAEIVHWLVYDVAVTKIYHDLFRGNISGNKVDQGETLVPYVQPLPLEGTGYHRFVFILFRQDCGRVDFSKWKHESDTNWQQRSFTTRNFYKQLEESITPCGLAFFQSQWDASCKRVLYERFGCKHPIYKYEWPLPLKMKQQEFPAKPQPFDLYLDQFRDPQEVNTELFKKRLAMLSPFAAPPKKPPFPDIFWREHHIGLPGWQHAQLVKSNRGDGRFRALWENPIDE